MHRRTFLKSIMAAGAATLFGGTAYAYRSISLEVSRQRCLLKGIKRSLRVVALSDVHAPCFYSASIDLFSIINDLEPIYLF